MEIFNWNQVKLQFFTILENVARPWNGLGNQLTNYHLEGGHTFGSCKGSYHHSLECHLCKGRFMRDFLQWLVICPVILADSWATTLFPFHLTHWIGNYILPCWCIGWGSLSNPLTLPETNIKSTWKWMVGILSYLPFGAFFRGYVMLVSGSVPCSNRNWNLLAAFMASREPPSAQSIQHFFSATLVIILFDAPVGPEKHRIDFGLGSLFSFNMR